MTQATTRTQAAEDKQRYTVVISKDHQARLGAIAKQFKISQGAVMEVLIDNAELEALAPKFTARREAKQESRGSKKALMEKLATLTPEQRAYLDSLGK